MPTSAKTKNPVKQKSPDSAQALDRLVRMVSRADDFVLGFVKCNHPLQQEEMRREFLARLGDKSVLEVELDKPLVSLLDELTPRWDFNNPPDVICVYGLEKSINELQEASPVLGRLNNDRDLLRRAVPTPLLIWLPDFALDFIARGAPDFWAWRSGVYEFRTEAALWQWESASAIISNVSKVISLSHQDKVTQITHLEELLRTAQNLSRKGKREERLIASLLDQLGLVYESLGRWKEASTAYQQCLTIFQRLADLEGVANTLHQIGILKQLQGNLTEAEHLYRQSWEINQEMGNKSNIAGDLHQMGRVEQERGNPQEAERLYSQSLALNREVDNRNNIASNLHQMAMIEQGRGNLGKAEQLYSESLEISQELGDRSSIGDTLHQFALLEQRRGNLRAAEHLYNQSLEIDQELGDEIGAAISLYQLARLMCLQDKPQAAVRNCLKSWTAFCRVDSSLSKTPLKMLQSIREAVGDEHFDEWLAEGLGPQATEFREKLNGALAAPADAMRQELTPTS